MELLEFYPPPSDLIQSELAVLDHLRSDPYIKERHSQFAQDAGIYYGRNREGHLRGFEFFSFFDIWHDPMHRKKAKSGAQSKHTPNARLIVAALIELKNGSFSNVTYCLSLCRPVKGFPILRKFHFDMTATSDTSHRRLQQHPRCHLQYCGEMLPQMARMGCRQTQLDQMFPWLSEPRIFFWPMSLALLIDMAFREFPDRRSVNFRESNEWRGIVRRHENLILRPFYEKCVEVIIDNKRNNRTLAEEFYVG